MDRSLVAIALFVAALDLGACGTGTQGASGSSGDGGGGGSSGGAGSSGAGSTGGGTGEASGDGGTDGSSGSGAGAHDSGTGSSSGSGSGSGAGSGSGSGAGSEGGVDGGSASRPFGCQLAWGEPSPSGSLSSYDWLQFTTTWVGSEVQADGSITSCSACGWLTGSVASTRLVPAYYAYFIGFYGHANGLPDQNQQPNGPNLATGGGALILGPANAACPSGQICASNKIVQMYASYAKQTHAVWPTKPLIWLIEGDFIQYTTEAGTQTQPLSYAQLGQLAVQIAAAIKANMPNAVVAFDDSAWVGNQDRQSYWSAIAPADYDMVWTTGVGNNPPFLNAGEMSSSYNGATATYSFLHSYTGKTILVDESAGMSQQSDTWSNQPASTLDQLIAAGVVAVNVSGAPSSYQSNVTALEPKLASTCP
jgi:hypothetical protein